MVFLAHGFLRWFLKPFPKIINLKLFSLLLPHSTTVYNEQTWFEAFHVNWKLCRSVVLEKIFFKWISHIFFFANSSPVKRIWYFISKHKLESPLGIDNIYQVWLKLAFWIWSKGLLHLDASYDMQGGDDRGPILTRILID
jgi:hypothetical protein